jgi:hypothetical protein
MFVTKKWVQKGMRFYEVLDSEGRLYLICGMKNLIKFFEDNRD